MTEILPMYLSIGVSEERFWDGCPTDLKPFVDAENLRAKRIDSESWNLGRYARQAVYVAISDAFMGNKSKAEYFDKPISMLVEENKADEDLTEEEKEQERQKLLLKLQVWQANFELNH